MRQKSRDLTSRSEKRKKGRDFCKNFQHRTTPYFVIFQTYSDDFNFKVHPYAFWPYRGETWLKFVFVDTHFGLLRVFFNIAQNFSNSNDVL